MQHAPLPLRQQSHFSFVTKISKAKTSCPAITIIGVVNICMLVYVAIDLAVIFFACCHYSTFSFLCFSHFVVASVVVVLLFSLCVCMYVCVLRCVCALIHSLGNPLITATKINSPALKNDSSTIIDMSNIP